jgi:hypothetical protein
MTERFCNWPNGRVTSIELREAEEPNFDWKIFKIKIRLSMVPISNLTRRIQGYIFFAFFFDNIISVTIGS